MTSHAAPAAVILAGGRGQRFGGPKGEALFLGRPLLAWVVDAAAAVSDEIVIVTAHTAADLPQLGHPVRAVPDREQYPGPLGGALAGFDALDTPSAFLLPCDAPLIRPAVLQRLHDANGEADDAVVPVIDGRSQPLIALYQTGPARAAFRLSLISGRRSMASAVEQLHTHFLDEATLRDADPMLLSFRGVNTPDELAVLEADARQHGVVAPS